ncbi:hypothetical protein ACIREE_39495 [Streptomyces sp. NPDC102467]|uniref:hypothetical protein n=1 Tax=Streptomyces sp. NPDC102467 TaxID=3366179 RepID=UPI003816549D
MQRFELAQWRRGPQLSDLRESVMALVKAGRRRTALDVVLRHLRQDPESTDGLFVALVALEGSRTALLECPEPPTDGQRASALLAPLATECSACHAMWYSQHTVLVSHGSTEINVSNPIGLQCGTCRYTLCRNCLSTSDTGSYTEDVDTPHTVRGYCENCRQQLTTPVLSTGRHDVQPIHPDTIEGVVVVRDGLIRPAMDEVLPVVMKFLPLVADDAPLLHVGRGTPGMMGDEATRDQLAQSLLLELELEGTLAPGAWVRSRRMFVLAGAANDTDYLVTVVTRKQGAADTEPGGVPGMRTYTFLLQVLAKNGVWSTVRDPHTGRTPDGGIGAVAAPEEMLPDIAEEVMERFSGFPLKRRVVFFEGDRTQGKLTTDDVHGVVTEGTGTFTRGLS